MFQMNIIIDLYFCFYIYRFFSVQSHISLHVVVVIYNKGSIFFIII